MKRDLRTKLIKLFYFLLLFWTIITVLAHEAPIMIAFPILFLFYFLFPLLSVVFFIWMVLTIKKWNIIKFVSIFLLLIPAVFTYFRPTIQHEIKVRFTTPSDAIIREYITTTSRSLDVSRPLSNYNTTTKTLEIQLIIKPTSFMRYQIVEGTGESLVQQGNYFMQSLYNELVNLPSGLSELTKQPDTITTYCYWGKEQIFQAQYEKSAGEYKMIKPYPTLTLKGENDSWYLHYISNGYHKSLFVKKAPHSNFQINLEPLLKDVN